MKEWAGLGYYSRARNLHRCAVIIAQDYQGRFPTHERELRKLPGIGPYTAAAISAIAFGRPCTVVDGNVERVMARLFNVAQPLKEAKGELYQYAQQLNSAVNESYHPGDFAQAVMDLGATVCTPSRPACLKCPVSQYCQAYHLNKQDHLPRRAVKSAKPQRYGVLYFCENSAGELLFERRPEKGLLGGMIGLPGSEWQGQDDISMKGEDKQGQSLIEHYYLKHTFTHFELHLKAMTVNYEDISLSGAPVFWHPLTEYDKLGLPNLYKKALQQYFTFKGL
jgi:A/G-specific adenine glycosylase